MTMIFFGGPIASLPPANFSLRARSAPERQGEKWRVPGLSRAVPPKNGQIGEINCLSGWPRVAARRVKSDGTDHGVDLGFAVAPQLGQRLAMTGRPVARSTR